MAPPDMTHSETVIADAGAFERRYRDISNGVVSVVRDILAAGDVTQHDVNRLSALEDQRRVLVKSVLLTCVPEGQRQPS